MALRYRIKERLDIMFNSPSRYMFWNGQLLTFHSSFFHSEKKIQEYSEHLELFLQIAHGVRPEKIDYRAANNCFLLAKKYRLWNVIRLIEDQLIVNDYIMDVEECFVFGLNRHLVIWLKEVESLEEMVEELEKVDIQDMSGEAMKQCVKFFMMSRGTPTVSRRKKAWHLDWCRCE
uniref:BTB domain-containing protein n=1 Tax=Caenorhabditis tropicalis TaxID=1561998 RepID=A0A1I7UKP7_9PELO